MTDNKKENAPAMPSANPISKNNYSATLKKIQPNTHIYKVLNHLIKNHTITSMQAFELYRNTRLSASIGVLRHDYGVDIVTESIVDVEGNIKSYKRYRLV